MKKILLLLAVVLFGACSPDEPIPENTLLDIDLKSQSWLYDTWFVYEEWKYSFLDKKEKWEYIDKEVSYTFYEDGTMNFFSYPYKRPGTYTYNKGVIKATIEYGYSVENVTLEFQLYNEYRLKLTQTDDNENKRIFLVRTFD